MKKSYIACISAVSVMALLLFAEIAYRDYKRAEYKRNAIARQEEIKAIQDEIARLYEEIEQKKAQIAEVEAKNEVIYRGNLEVHIRNMKNSIGNIEKWRNVPKEEREERKEAMKRSMNHKYLMSHNGEYVKLDALMHEYEKRDDLLSLSQEDYDVIYPNTSRYEEIFNLGMENFIDKNKDWLLWQDLAEYAEFVEVLYEDSEEYKAIYDELLTVLSLDEKTLSNAEIEHLDEVYASKEMYEYNFMALDMKYEDSFSMFRDWIVTQREAENKEDTP